MFLTSSKSAGIRLKLIFAVAIVGLVVLGDSASSRAAASFWSADSMPPNPSALPSPTAAPVSTQSPAALPSGTPTTTPAVPASPSASPAGTAGPGSRNLALYENGGVIAIGLVPTQQEAALSQVRAFLLRKWNARSPGRLSLIFSRPSGPPAAKNFFIEPDTGGTWKITIEMQEDDPADFYVVEDIGVDANGRALLPPLTGVSVSRALHLKKSNGTKSGLIL